MASTEPFLWYQCLIIGGDVQWAEMPNEEAQFNEASLTGH